MKQVRLNRVEVWIADHALPIFAVVALAIVAGAVAITLVFIQAQKAGDQVNVLKPQVTRVNKAICDKQSLGHPQRAERCAERIRVGLINCRRSTSCRAAYLALATYPPPAKPARGATSPGSPEPSPGSSRDTGGGDAQQPSNNGHQQPAPGKGAESPAEPSPAPPAATGGPGVAEPGKPAEAPGNGPPAESGKSGVDVEVCVVEGTCVGAEVGVGLGP
jgi:hypothetical protein